METILFEPNIWIYFNIPNLGNCIGRTLISEINLEGFTKKELDFHKSLSEEEIIKLRQIVIFISENYNIGSINFNEIKLPIKLNIELSLDEFKNFDSNKDAFKLLPFIKPGIA